MNCQHKTAASVFGARKVFGKSCRINIGEFGSLATPPAPPRPPPRTGSLGWNHFSVWNRKGCFSPAPVLEFLENGEPTVPFVRRGPGGRIHFLPVQVTF